jgi:hypothetical protein
MSPTNTAMDWTRPGRAGHRERWASRGEIDKFRSICIKLGEALGLYKDERVAKNCTPSYLPEFIRVEVAKRE